MKIKKLGHCCLLIEEGGLKILTDPGSYSTLQSEVKGIDLVLITHDHQDHLHMDSLKTVLKNNSQAKIVTNKSVGKLLDAEGIKYEACSGGENTTLNKVLIEGFGLEHAPIYEGIPVGENTGYFIANKLFYPGDAFTDPGKSVEVLALPVAGPWLRISDALNYAQNIRPKIAFPVHDGMLKNYGSAHFAPARLLPSWGIEFRILEEGGEAKV